MPKDTYFVINFEDRELEEFTDIEEAEEYIDNLSGSYDVDATEESNFIVIKNGERLTIDEVKKVTIIE